ncbi:unnamed protein product [Heligmosomoides polygyrus]|uniref:PI-PLC Y-box domain-containing protein n=1 Tax=Heligmosomoides polygyrus TaxID=6339 RepID=A0A183FPI5_HELPZ|nr:unnamed protein product [Heligmosomoides polygyrus]
MEAKRKVRGREQQAEQPRVIRLNYELAAAACIQNWGSDAARRVSVRGQFAGYQTAAQEPNMEWPATTISPHGLLIAVNNLHLDVGEKHLLRQGRTACRRVSLQLQASSSCKFLRRMERTRAPQQGVSLNS